MKLLNDGVKRKMELEQLHRTEAQECINWGRKGGAEDGKLKSERQWWPGN